MNSMYHSFCYCLELLKVGFCFSRREWDRKYIIFKKLNGDLNDNSHYIAIINEEGESKRWGPTQEDILSDDWFVVKQ